MKKIISFYDLRTMFVGGTNCHHHAIKTIWNDLQSVLYVTPDTRQAFVQTLLDLRDELWEDDREVLLADLTVSVLRKAIPANWELIHMVDWYA